MPDFDIYAWLYNHYVVPQLEPLDEGQQAALREFAARLGMTQKNQLHLLDLVGNMRLDWGTEAFALGVRFGLDLSAPRAALGDPDGLLHLLAQLDQAVP